MRRDDLGLRVDCQQGGEGRQFWAQSVVNTAGFWLNQISHSQAHLTGGHPTGWCKASNLVLSRQLESTFGVGVSGGEHRLFFTVPRENGSCAGTFYAPHSGSPDELTVSGAEIEYALKAYNQALPAARLNMGDVALAEAGVLPVKRRRPGMPLHYGRERIFQHNGYAAVLSTKYTTFQTQADRVLDAWQAGCDYN